MSDHRLPMLALALVAALGAGCSDTPGAPAGALVQTVRLEPSEPRTGEPVRVVSEIRNRGARTAVASHRICGLTLGGDLALAIPPGSARCAGYSAESELAPGIRIEGADERIVRSPPGTYVLTIQHLLGPPQVTTVLVRVRE